MGFKPGPVVVDRAFYWETNYRHRDINTYTTMFILRRISGDGVEMNFELGQTYTIVERFISYEAFQREFERFFDRPHVADLDPTSDEITKKVYAFIGTEGGLNIYPLYLGQKAYIMTESGKTFNNLTIKTESKP